MLKTITGIAISLLLLLPATQMEPIVKEFPKAEDGWGRPVFYNTLNDNCENIVGRDVGCPYEMKMIVKRPE